MADADGGKRQEGEKTKEKKFKQIKKIKKIKKGKSQEIRNFFSNDLHIGTF